MAKDFESNRGALLTALAIITAAIITVIGVKYNADKSYEAALTVSAEPIAATQTAEARLTTIALSHTLAPTITAIPPTPAPLATLTVTPTNTTARPTSSVAPASVTPIPTPTPLGGGGTIAFYSDRDPHLQLYMINPDGSNERRLRANDEYNDGAPRWSPDGCSVIFDSAENSRFDIKIVDLDGLNLRTLISDSQANYQQPSWSWSGERIVLSSNHYEFSPYFKNGSDLFEIGIDGKGLRRITNNPDIDSINSGDIFPVYSPNDSRVAYTSLRNGKAQVYWVNVNELTPRILTGDEAQSWDPAWSPDGKKIAFTTNKSGSSQIYVMNLDGGSVSRISDGNSEDSRPAWSPDSRFILFNADRNDNGKRQIYRMNAEGSPQITRITKGPGNNVAPAWSPRQCQRIAP